MITNVDEALAKLKSFPPCRKDFNSLDDDWITDILEASTGKAPTGETVYRVYYAAAEALKLAGHLGKVKGKTSYLQGSVEYFADTHNINHFLDMQAKEDNALGLTVGAYSAVDLSARFEPGRQAWVSDRDEITTKNPEYLEDRYIRRSGSGTVGGSR
jgi:hypothetical protein